MRLFLALLLTMLVSTGYAANFNAYPNEETVADADELMFWDVSAGGVKNVTYAVLRALVAASPIVDAGNYFITDTIEAALQEIGAGAGYVSTAPTYSDEACTAGQYAFTTTTGYVCVSSGDWNTFALTDWSNPTPDTTPNQFTFVDQVGVALGTEITSALVQITGINTATAVTATGGTAAICTTNNILDCGTFGASPGNITNGRYVAARHTSSASNSTVTSTVVTIGGVSDTFTSTTVGGPTP